MRFATSPAKPAGRSCTTSRFRRGRATSPRSSRISCAARQSACTPSSTTTACSSRPGTTASRSKCAIRRR